MGRDTRRVALYGSIDETSYNESRNKGAETETSDGKTPSPHRRVRSKLLRIGVAVASLLLLCVVAAYSHVLPKRIADDTVTYNVQHQSFPILRKSIENDYGESPSPKEELLQHRPIPSPERRCHVVQERFEERDGPDPDKRFGKMYAKQMTDVNIFYRATAHIWWHDVRSEWSVMQRLLRYLEVQLPGDLPLTPLSTWTWVTGDQHLSNFGAWRNRHGDVVFGVNDFDEAAVFDFQVDVLRIAVSICNHALTNGFNDTTTKKALRVLTDSYINTILGYVGNEKALLFELNPQTSYGVLQTFLKKVDRKESKEKQLKKFTEYDPEQNRRYFIKGIGGASDNRTKLASVPSETDAKIRAAFTSTQYGATMMKLGWNVRQWDDEYFEVLDVAARIGSGIGSYGVERYYVLIKGTDTLLEEDEDGTAVILDVKFQPPGAVERILNENEKAWYNVLFQNSAARVVEGQRRLTSYVDPFTGWIMIEDDDGVKQPFSIRQRSPWKESVELDDLTDPDDFMDFTAQVAMATATSHVRGTVAKAPEDFKNVINAIMKKRGNRKRWGEFLGKTARVYHEQVLLDYSCFVEWVNATYRKLPELSSRQD